MNTNDFSESVHRVVNDILMFSRSLGTVRSTIDTTGDISWGQRQVLFYVAELVAKLEHYAEQFSGED